MALLKPKDDLRKDSRFMELCEFLKNIFRKHGDEFQMTTFAVTALNDECGIIEWVFETSSFRGILLKLYKKQGISFATRDIKDLLSLKISSLEKFVCHLLPRYLLV